MLETTQEAPTPVYRKDYTPPSHWIDTVALDFSIEDDETVVTARLDVRRNADVNDGSEPLVLVGEELELRRVAIDGSELAVGEFDCAGEELRIPNVPDRFVLETVVAIHPERNTQLSGLYASSGNLCTQCEAEGFRRITYFLDRPDVMATYTVRIEASKARYPILLSNGNRVGAGDAENGRHWASWEDPFKKPSYLFALVAGNLVCHRGEFVTRSNRTIPLEIWVEPQNIDKCEHALLSLQQSMKWDEDVFGLEIDLDLYMIFVADDFNMGAMENKGLNVFNSKYVLARPDTATDDDYEGIQGVIAHEYFHNWTGNRVTCRDWFQLTLKEGLTVFRDQRFSADMTSAPVKRIQDVRALRSRQFAEDAGPMAHPIRPESYIEMNNFYTSTVYEKGAQVVGIYHTLLGAEGFRKGMDLYFQRHDGQAVECTDFRRAMADANGVNLDQMERWYSQAGTPTVRVDGVWNPEDETYTLALEQISPEIAGLPESKPLLIPVRVGLLGPDGADLPLTLEGEDTPGPTERVLQLSNAAATFVFTGVGARPVASVMRDFSGPVKLEMERSRDDLAFLMANDSDPFNRWDSGQTYAKQLILGLVEDVRAGRALALDPAFVDAFGRILGDTELDGSLKSLALTLPDEVFLGQQMAEIDPDAIHTAREFVARELARGLRAAWLAAYVENASAGPYSNDKAAIDRRRLKNRALAYLVMTGDEGTALAAKQFAEADNMTDAQAALVCLNEVGGAACDEANASFYARWKGEPLVLDKWFTVQAASGREGTVERVIALSAHPDFTLKNPNRARSLVGVFAMTNQVHFHRADGAGYEFVVDQTLALDALNGQVAARIASCFNQWKRFDAARQAAMRASLERIAAHPGLSKDVTEIVGRALA